MPVPEENMGNFLNILEKRRYNTKAKEEKCDKYDYKKQFKLLYAKKYHHTEEN